MAKTNPIGVRFDESLMAELKEENLADSPQRALNFLESFYRMSKLVNSRKVEVAETTPESFDGENFNGHIADEVGQSQSTPDNKEQNKEVVDKKIPEMPIREKGEDAFDFATRKNEWKVLYG